MNRQIEEARKLYTETIYVNCPALNNEPVYFSRDGFSHLIFKGRHKRSPQEIKMRLDILSLARKVISKTTFYQEYDQVEQLVSQREQKQRVHVKKIVTYWGLIAVIGDYKIKVIIKQIGDGNKRFWSVIPNWVTNKTRDGKFIRKFSKGDLEND